MKTVVVLALPRSGSSLLSGVLHHLGVNMGESVDLFSGKHMNKFGCYENQDFLKLNTNIMVSAGSLIGWHDLPDEEKVKKSFNTFIPRVKKTIKKYESALWGFKNMNGVFVIPYLHDYLINPYYVYLKRDVDKVVKSQKRIALDNSKNYLSIRHFISFFHPFLLFKLGYNWVKNFIKQGNFIGDEGLLRTVVKAKYRFLDEFIKDKCFFQVSLNELVNKPKIVIYRLIKFLKIKPSKNELKAALDFIRPEELHY